MKKRRLVNDIILIAILVLIPTAMLILGNSPSDAGSDALVVITIDGALYETLPLHENTELTIISKAGVNTVIINEGTVRVSDADCPDKICVAHKAISKEGEQIVCLPHRLVLEIVSGENSEIDSLSQ